MERWEYEYDWIYAPHTRGNLEVTASAKNTIKARGAGGWEMVSILPVGSSWLAWYKQKVS
jgi:hypothetical protein